MKTFNTLLDTLIKAPNEKKGEVERFINEAYQQHKVVLALDMSGFTISVQRDGILAHLCRIRRMQLLTAPIIQKNHGQLVKFEADNVLAVFDKTDDAVRASIQMVQAANKENVEEIRKISFSIGIDVGTIILLDEIDCFGDSVNLAHKLGEDLAKVSEILITDKAFQSLEKPEEYDLQPTQFTISGLKLSAHRCVAFKP